MAPKGHLSADTDLRTAIDPMDHILYFLERAEGMQSTNGQDKRG